MNIIIISAIILKMHRQRHRGAKPKQEM